MAQYAYVLDIMKDMNERNYGKSTAFHRSQINTERKRTETNFYQKRMSNHNTQAYRRYPGENNSIYPTYPAIRKPDHQLQLYNRYGNIQTRTLRGFSDQKDHTQKIQDDASQKVQFTRSRGFTEFGQTFQVEHLLPQVYNNIPKQTSYRNFSEPKTSIPQDKPTTFRKFQKLNLANQPSGKWYSYFTKKEQF